MNVGLSRQHQFRFNIGDNFFLPELWYYILVYVH